MTLNELIDELENLQGLASLINCLTNHQARLLSEAHGGFQQAIDSLTKLQETFEEDQAA